MKKNKLSKVLLLTSFLSVAMLGSCSQANTSTTSGNEPISNTSAITPNTPTQDETIVIPVVDKEEKGITLTSMTPYTEGAYVKWNVATGSTAADYSVFYTRDNISYTPVDDELIRINNNEARVDILGLKAARYKIKIVNTKTSDYAITKTLDVTKDDRSGYAHFNNDKGVGAYNNDGSLKANAIVVYVNDSNKNTVKATINGTEQTGLVNIIKAATNAEEALDIRILGEIQTQQWNKKEHGTGKTADRMTNLDTAFASVNWEETTENELLNPGTARSSNYYKISEPDIIKYGINSMSNDEAKGITRLNGLTNNILKDIEKSKSGYQEYDSYYNELDVRFGENITIEGVGDDAKIFQWGFCFNQCNSIEVKNIEFSDYNEDAIGIQGASSDITKYSDYWIHNCTFNSGKNNWDVCYENDKKEGDGSTDFKSAHDLTISYCRYNETHKTALVGSGSTSYQYNVTFHHNFYNTCGSRLPFTRNTNFHIYNCYYYKSTGTNMQIDDTAYAFIEGCYFEDTNKTFTTSGGVIKLYNNTINNTVDEQKYLSGSTIHYVGRTELVTNNCKADKVTDYSSFDTNSKLFYYDDTNNVSKVDLMNKSEDIKALIPTIAGAGLLKSIDYSGNYTETNQGYVDTKVTATYTTTVPTEAGTYYSTLDTNGAIMDENNVTASTVVKVDDSKIIITDTDANATTAGYYILSDANQFSSGTHTYTLNIKLEGVGSSWYFLRFLDENRNDSLCVGTSRNTKHIGYTLDINNITEATNETDIDSQAFAANTSYEIKLIVNYDTKTATLSVGSKSVEISNFDINITGLKFFTAKTATNRSFTVTSITVE